MSLKLYQMSLMSVMLASVKFTYASGPVIIEEPSDVTSVQGLEVILRCVVENLPLEKDMVQWTKSGFALGFERDLSGFPRYSMVGDESIGEYNLRIENVTLGDEDEYECQVTMHMMRSRKAIVTVLVEPNGPSIDDVDPHSYSSLNVQAYSDNLITCRSWNGKPTAELKWFKDGEQVLGNVTYAETDASTKLKNSSATLRIWPTEENDETIYECVMTVDDRFLNANSNGLKTRRMTVQLNVQQPPVASIKLSSSKVKEGGVLTAKCDSSHSKPTATSYNWFINGIKVKDEIYSSLTLLNVNRTQNGMVIGCQSVNGVGLSTISTMKFIVLYGPTLITAPVNIVTNMSERVNFTCVWDANPKPSITWYKRGVSDTAVGEGEDLTLDVTDQSFSGVYVCVADVAEVGNKVATARLDVLGPPIISSPGSQEVALGGDAKVECRLGSVPAIYNVVWKWEKGGVSMSLTNNDTTIIENNDKASTSSKYRGELVQGNTVAYLVIHEAEPKDLISYNCTVTNGYGSASATMTIQELSSPEQAVMVGSIVGGVIGACFVIVLIFIVCICCMRRKRQQKSTTFNHEVEALQSVDQKHPTEISRKHAGNGISSASQGIELSPDPDSDNRSTSGSLSSRGGAPVLPRTDVGPPTQNDDGYHTEEANSWNRMEKQSPESSPSKSARDDYQRVTAPLLSPVMHSPPLTSSPLGALERPTSPYTSSEVSSDLGTNPYRQYQMPQYQYNISQVAGPNGLVDLPPPRQNSVLSQEYARAHPVYEQYYQPSTSSVGFRSGAYPPTAYGVQRTRSGSNTPSVVSFHRNVTPSPAPYVAMLGRATPLSVMGDRAGYYVPPSQEQKGQTSSHSSLEHAPSSVAPADPYENAAKMSQLSSRLSQSSRSSEFPTRPFTARMATHV